MKYQICIHSSLWWKLSNLALDHSVRRSNLQVKLFLFVKWIIFFFNNWLCWVVGWRRSSVFHLKTEINVRKQTPNAWQDFLRKNRIQVQCLLRLKVRLRRNGGTHSCSTLKDNIVNSFNECVPAVLSEYCGTKQ